MTSTRAYRIAAVLLAWLILRGQVPGFAETGEDRIYWADVDGIYWSNLAEGTTQRIITADTRRPGKIAVDAAGGKIYWVDKRGSTIHWSDLDGSNSEPLIGESSSVARDEPSGGSAWQRMAPEGINKVLLYWSAGGQIEAIDIALDLEAGKVYCAMFVNHGDYRTGNLFRANLDGSDPEMFTEWSDARSLALDTARGIIYVGARGWIYRVDLSGSAGEEIVSGTRPRDVALDMAGNKLYWATDRSIRRSNPDGSDVEDVLTGLDDYPEEIGLDPEGGKIYWRFDSPRYGGLLRADLDGSEVEYVVAGATVVGFALDLKERKAYWSDARGTIHRASMDGTDVEDLFAPLVRAPYSVALDPGDARIYWSDLLTGSILRAGLDASGLEIVVRDLKSPRGVLLGGNRLYWADLGAGKVQSAKLDGSDLKDIATEGNPDKLALDLVHRSVYWTDLGRSLIRRADLEGTHIQDLPVDGNPNGIALDVSDEKMYWTWGRENSIGLSRSNLDGTDVEDLVIGEPYYEGYRAVALDSAGGKIYWTSVYSPPTEFGEPVNYSVRVYRANLDGSEAEGLGWLPPIVRYRQPELMANSLALHFSRRTSASAPNSAPISTTLRSSYPNPFNGSTLIPYTLAAPGPVSLIVYNTLGQPVQALVDRVQAPGLYGVPWQPAEGLASGVYLYRLTTPDAVLTRRLTLLR